MQAKGSEVGTLHQPAHTFLGSFPGPMGPDPILGPQSNHWGSHGALCSGGTARPRAVWEPEDLILLKSSRTREGWSRDAEGATGNTGFGALSC